MSKESRPHVGDNFKAPEAKKPDAIKTYRAKLEQVVAEAQADGVEGFDLIIALQEKAQRLEGPKHETVTDGKDAEARAAESVKA